MEFPGIIEILFIISFLASLIALYFLRKGNIDLLRRNELLKKRLRSAKRKIEQWKRGWGPEKQHILEALSDAFLLVDTQGRIMFANEKAEHLFNTSELEGSRLDDCGGTGVLLDEVRKAVGINELYTSCFSLPASQAEGSNEAEAETYWYIDAAPVVGIERYRRIVIRDITEQHRTEQVRKDFVANASHELRTPMTIILGYLETLQEDGFLAESPELAKKFLATMLKHGMRMQRIVEDMLVISKLESGREGILNEQEFDFRDCVIDVFSRLEPIADKQRASLKMSFPNGDALVYGDHYYWTQILFNLVENALKQNREPGLAVEVGFAVSGDHASIWVSDSGVGIPAAHIPYVFKRFYRVDSSNNKEVSGTGLGLSIVKRAVEAHDGELSVVSNPGVETKFMIKLPLSRIIASGEAGG